MQEQRHGWYRSLKGPNAKGMRAYCEPFSSIEEKLTLHMYPPQLLRHMGEIEQPWVCLTGMRLLYGKC